MSSNLPTHLFISFKENNAVKSTNAINEQEMFWDLIFVLQSFKTICINNACSTVIHVWEFGNYYFWYSILADKIMCLFNSWIFVAAQY